MTVTKPASASDVLDRLTAVQNDLGKGSRRLAEFLISNPSEMAIRSTAQIAERCGVHPSSVVRLAQALGLSGYKELRELLQGRGSAPDSLVQNVPRREIENPLRLHLLAESGQSFNEDAAQASAAFSAANPEVAIRVDVHVSHDVDPDRFADMIEAAGENADGLLLVAREHPSINHAVRTLVGRGTPVVCITSDLPSSGRTAYVGVDQYAGGAMAGLLCGRFLPQGHVGRVLFVCSVPFRCQQEREQGFRHVLRTQFPTLEIDEKVSSDESIEVIYDAVRRYIAKNGPPSAIYNVSGANRGVARALEEAGIEKETVFIGHELNMHSRRLLEKGIMDIAIGHNFRAEIAAAVEAVRVGRQGLQAANHVMESQLFTPFNCPTL